jgi:glucokinase
MFSTSALQTWLGKTMVELFEEAELDVDAGVAAGVALPGPLDPDRRTIVRSVNIPFLDGEPFAEELSRRVRCKCVLLTDAEAATWGEYVSRGPRCERFVHLRLGTGVACSAVIEGELVRLDTDREGHLGLLVVASGESASMCRCGRRGCLETLASGPALKFRALELGYKTGLTELQQVWQAGDATVARLVDEVAEAVTTVVNNLARHFEARVICIGGGVVMRLPGLLEQTVKRFHSSGPETREAAVSVEPALLGDDAGLIGAALLALHLAQAP